MATGYIHSTESFGTLDGPGIRYVVFMQGCPLRCKYCHNPDTWEIGRGSSATVGELLAEFEKNRAFYSSGGITVTGGEPLMQLDFVTELFSEAKKRGIHTCLDTSGITYSEKNAKSYVKLLSFTDLAMLDIKHIRDDAHRGLTGRGNANILSFAKLVSEQNIPLWIRTVIVKGVTDNEDDLLKLGEFIGELKTLKALDVLPYHTMGIAKYKELDIPYPLDGVPPLSKEDAIAAKNIILKGIRNTRKS
ncbi:MAG: pyruvate formate lyase-activating protein [Oscillospiraceae bacterium]|nr:pyruvate formate lyase-activating protein [Oscillospiraceae bacterium]